MSYNNETKQKVRVLLSCENVDISNLIVDVLTLADSGNMEFIVEKEQSEQKPDVAIVNIERPPRIYLKKVEQFNGEGIKTLALYTTPYHEKIVAEANPSDMLESPFKMADLVNKVAKLSRN